MKRQQRKYNYPWTYFIKDVIPQFIHGGGCGGGGEGGGSGGGGEGGGGEGGGGGVGGGGGGDGGSDCGFSPKLVFDVPETPCVETRMS